MLIELVSLVLYISESIPLTSLIIIPFTHDLFGNSPYCLLHIACNFSFKNLALNQMIIHQLIFFITCLLEIVLIL